MFDNQIMGKFRFKFKSILFLLLFFSIIIFPLWSEEEERDMSLETILQERNATVVIYFIPSNYYTTIPVNIIGMRNSYWWKIVFRPRVYNRLNEILIAAHNRVSDQPQPLNIRILIDILINNEIVYTIPLSYGIEYELIDAIYKLLGVTPEG